MRTFLCRRPQPLPPAGFALRDAGAWKAPSGHSGRPPRRWSSSSARQVGPKRLTVTVKSLATQPASRPVATPEPAGPAHCLGMCEGDASLACWWWCRCVHATRALCSKCGAPCTAPSCKKRERLPTSAEHCFSRRALCSPLLPCWPRPKIVIHNAASKHRSLAKPTHPPTPDCPGSSSLDLGLPQVLACRRTTAPPTRARRWSGCGRSWRRGARGPTSWRSLQSGSLQCQSTCGTSAERPALTAQTSLRASGGGGGAVRGFAACPAATC